MVDQKSERLDTRVVAAVGVILHIGDSRRPCMSRNVSRGGIFVLCRLDLDVGTEIRVEIVHHGTRMTSDARIATVTEDGLGLAFVRQSPQFQLAIEGLIRDLVKAPEGSTPEGNVRVRAAWSVPEEGGGWGWFKKKQQTAELISLSLDGAAIVSKKAPAIGTVVVVTLEGDDGEPCLCDAEIVRHTESGFAVRFMSPSMDFRRTITRLRKGAVI